MLLERLLLLLRELLDLLRSFFRNRPLVFQRGEYAHHFIPLEGFFVTESCDFLFMQLLLSRMADTGVHAFMSRETSIVNIAF